MTTFILLLLMMAGLFLLLWGAVGFVQDKRFFTSAPQAIQDGVQPKPERFPGQHILGWCMIVLALGMMGGAVVYGAWDGIRNGFGFWQFFARFLILFWGQKVFDIAVFDWFLLCHSGFYPHYFPEIREVVGPHLFGYNWKSHLIEIISHLIVSALLSVICMRKSPLSGREESSVTAC